MEKIKDFFSQYINHSDFEITSLPQSGSSRKNHIIKTSNLSYIITENDNLRENESFFYFSEVFSSLNLNTPKIFKISKDRKTYIQEFLGEETLSQIIEKERESERVVTLVKQTLKKLFHLQQATLSNIDYSKTFEYEVYDEFPICHDLNYFKFLFVDILELHYHKLSLLKEFKELAKIIEILKPKSLMIRDFQSRNIMVNQEEVFFIDYQSAMKGPVMYDVISFLFQAKANFSNEFRNEMLDFYINLFKNKVEREALYHSIMPIRLIRNLQVLGAYGFRGLVQNKEHFKKSIFLGIDNLFETAQSWEQMECFPELHQLIYQLKSESTVTKILSKECSSV